MINYAKKIKKFRLLDNELHKNIACWAPFQAIHINKRGNVRPTPFSDPIGKWSPDNKILDIWNSTLFEDIRDLHSIGRMPSTCAYCSKSIDKGKPPSSLDYETSLLDPCYFPLELLLALTTTLGLANLTELPSFLLTGL